MRSYLKTLKISLITVSLSACAGFPQPPEINPRAVIVSQDKAFACKVVDIKNLIFTCSKISTTIKKSGLDSGYCVTTKEMSDLLIWGRNVKDYAEKNCK